MRSRVSMVMRLPSRKRCTSLPSLTERRPKVDSAISAWRQYCDIRLKIWSFFMEKDLGHAGGQRRGVGLSYHHLPTGGTPSWRAARLARVSNREAWDPRPSFETPACS